jgi:hypothetical protein
MPNIIVDQNGFDVEIAVPVIGSHFFWMKVI